MPRSLRVGGYTFAETPSRSAPDARLLWSAAFDPSVLRARPVRPPVGTTAAPPHATWFAVAGEGWCHAVIGGIHHGGRIDIVGSRVPSALDRLIFPLTVAIAPRQLAEFRRLVALSRGQPLAVYRATPRHSRIIRTLRIIDALGEGASLRSIGEAFVRAGDWPGRGESTKSAARRLRDAALAIWDTGPRIIF